MDLKEQLKSLSAQDRKELLKQLQQEEKESKRNRRDAYEGLRAQFMLEVKNRLLPVVDDVKAFRDWVEKEAAAFRAVRYEYTSRNSSFIILHYNSGAISRTTLSAALRYQGRFTQFFRNTCTQSRWS